MPKVTPGMIEQCLKNIACLERADCVAVFASAKSPNELLTISKSAASNRTTVDTNTDANLLKIKDLIGADEEL